MPFLSGFDVNWVDSSGRPDEHPLRQLRVDVQADGWHTGGFEGPGLRAIVGIRDNSGGNPPDDPFVTWLHLSALVTFDYKIDANIVPRPLT